MTITPLISELQRELEESISEADLREKIEMGLAELRNIYLSRRRAGKSSTFLPPAGVGRFLFADLFAADHTVPGTDFPGGGARRSRANSGFFRVDVRFQITDQSGTGYVRGSHGFPGMVDKRKGSGALRQREKRFSR